MKAMLCPAYGPPEVFRLADVPLPTPLSGQVRIRVEASAVNSADWRIRKADPAAVRLAFGFLRPKRPILGISLCGTVEAVGNQVSRFRPGDRVFGSAGLGMGAYAEYICLPETACLAQAPSAATPAEAAVLPFGGMTALHFLRKAGLTAGQHVLIYGASGAVGTAAVQIARDAGAIVTGVCSGANMDLVKSLGATHMIDYTREDVSAAAVQYDIAMIAVDKLSFRSALSLVKPGGHLILSDAGAGDTIRAWGTSLRESRRVLTGMAGEKPEYLDWLRDRFEAGAYRAVIERNYPLAQLAEAHRHAEAGHKKGNIAILIDSAGEQPG